MNVIPPHVSGVVGNLWVHITCPTVLCQSVSLLISSSPVAHGSQLLLIPTDSIGAMDILLIIPILVLLPHVVTGVVWWITLISVLAFTLVAAYLILVMKLGLILLRVIGHFSETARLIILASMVIIKMQWLPGVEEPFLLLFNRRVGDIMSLIADSPLLLYPVMGIWIKAPHPLRMVLVAYMVVSEIMFPTYSASSLLFALTPRGVVM